MKTGEEPKKNFFYFFLGWGWGGGAQRKKKKPLNKIAILKKFIKEKSGFVIFLLYSRRRVYLVNAAEEETIIFLFCEIDFLPH